MIGHEVVWRPPLDGSTRIEQFMERVGVETFEQLLARSLQDPAWFWGAITEHLGLPFDRPYDSVLDISGGIPWARWFTGGTTNMAAACVDRWSDSQPGAVALVWEGEDGEQRELTYGELRRQVDTLSFLLEAHGIGEGDTVGIFLPMIPEVVVAAMAVAKLGAIFLPIFSGYGADAVAVRLTDAGSRALITADGFLRRGRQVPMLDVARTAAAEVDTLRTIVVVPRLARLAGGAPSFPPESSPAEHGPACDEVRFPEPADGAFPTRMVDSEHPLFIAYTSGTTGTPKGSVHVHGGFTAKIAEEVAFQFDVRGHADQHHADHAHGADRLFWFADFGWIMGPWEIVGGLANGATVCLYEGAPDWPGPDRLWDYCARHRVTVLGISPTFIRAAMGHGDDPVLKHDLSALRILGSTGEPWNADPWHWYFEVVGGGRCPVINISGGTEVGACFLSPHPVQEITPMTLGGPAVGMAVEVFDDEGHAVRQQVGELVCTAPWPGMTRGLWMAPERYLETYWSRWPDVWVHGDRASIEDGRWYLHGRSDDIMKIAGKRLGPAEVESALVSHPAVLEAAAVGLPDDLKGEALWAFVVLAAGIEPSEGLRRELIEVVTDHLGKSFKPSGVRFVTALPKTRSAKVMRRAIRATALGADPGDLSPLDDPGSIEAIRLAR